MAPWKDRRNRRHNIAQPIWSYSIRSPSLGNDSHVCNRLQPFSRGCKLALELHTAVSPEAAMSSSPERPPHTMGDISSDSSEHATVPPPDARKELGVSSVPGQAGWGR